VFVEFDQLANELTFISADEFMLGDERHSITASVVFD
jgi:hypothetical protein